MEAESSNNAAEAVIEILTTRGWCIGDINQLNAIIIIQTALSDDDDPLMVADSVESELLNMDLRSIGAKSLPDPNLLHKTSLLRGPKVLQISSVRDISVSSLEGFSDSSNRRVLKLVLTDGQIEITAIEYSNIPSIPNDVVPGTKVRLENKVVVNSGIVCLNPNVITLMGGVVQSLYDEWKMNQKYLGTSRSLSRLSQESDNGGPPPFEKLQIGVPFNRSSKQGRYSDYSDSTSKSSVPNAAESAGNTEISAVDAQQKAGGIDDKEKSPVPAESIEQNLRPKEVAESVPVQNQAAAQKLLQKMNYPIQSDRQLKGRKHRGKGKQEEPSGFTLEEWEKRNNVAKPQMTNGLSDTSYNEDLARQLQNQLDVEDSQVERRPHHTMADDIRMSMFNYERDANRAYGSEYEGQGRGKGRRWGKGRGRGSGQGRGRGRYS